jgi:hypothetical protein
MWMYVYFLLVIQCNSEGRNGNVERTNLREVQVKWRGVNRGRRKRRELMAGTEISTCPSSPRIGRTMGINSIKACSKCNSIIQ